MVKRINKGVVKLGETGRSAGAIITGANLRKPPKESRPPEPSKEAEQEEKGYER
jgi:hypothetical protein